MAVLLITYDLNRETKRPPLLEAVKEAGISWCKLSESSYAIETNETPDQIYNKLQVHIDSNDRITIIHLKKPWQGWQSREVIDWLNNRLSY